MIGSTVAAVNIGFARRLRVEYRTALGSRAAHRLGWGATDVAQGRGGVWRSSRAAPSRYLRV